MNLIEDEKAIDNLKQEITASNNGLNLKIFKDGGLVLVIRLTGILVKIYRLDIIDMVLIADRPSL